MNHSTRGLDLSMTGINNVCEGNTGTTSCSHVPQRQRKPGTEDVESYGDEPALHHCQSTRSGHGHQSIKTRTGQPRLLGLL